MDYDPGYLDLEQKALQPLDIPFGTRLSSVDRPGLPQWRDGFLAKTAARGGLCDDEGAPLICPTCQVLAQSVLAGDRPLLCMGLFSIFLVGSQSDAAWLRESCLKRHTTAAPPL